MALMFTLVLFLYSGGGAVCHLPPDWLSPHHVSGNASCDRPPKAPYGPGPAAQRHGLAPLYSVSHRPPLDLQLHHSFPAHLPHKGGTLPASLRPNRGARVVLLCLPGGLLSGSGVCLLPDDRSDAKEERTGEEVWHHCC